VYLAEGEGIRLFDQYDNDGYSLAVEPAAGGSVELRVRVSDSPLRSSAPFPTGAPRDEALAPAPERDAFAREATRDCGRADCVGFAELAVDLLRRVGIRARTVQGILRTEPAHPAYDPRIGGAYHRWIEVYYPDRGYVFSDPSTSINGVDARYIPFRGRSLVRPRGLTLVFVDRSGDLSYLPVPAGPSTLRERPSGK
jgi:hypothetical protein